MLFKKKTHIKVSIFLFSLLRKYLEIKLKMLKLLISLTILVVSCNAVNWNGNWAPQCDFLGKDMGSVKSQGSECGPKCGSTSGFNLFSYKLKQFFK